MDNVPTYAAIGVAIVLWTLNLSLSGCAATSTQGSRAGQTVAAKGTVPEERKFESIFLATNSGWTLQIRQDGSGTLGIGSSGTDFDECPAGTFDFTNVEESIWANSGPTDADGDDFVNLQLPDKTKPTFVLYSGDHQLILKLLNKAYQSITPSYFSRVAELWAKSPPK